MSVGEDANILSYTDVFDAAEWAVPAFQWACGAEAVSAAALSPQARAARGQLAAILAGHFNKLRKTGRGGV